MLTYFSWWYGEGLMGFWRSVEIMTTKIYNFFSIGKLAATLFAPWKRDSYSVENASLDVRLRIVLDNLISRFVGAVLRLVLIIFGLTATIIFFTFFVVILAAWFILPILILFLIANGTRIMING